MKKRICLILLLSITAMARADWSGPYALSIIESDTGNNGIYFKTPQSLAAFPNPYGCSNAGWIYFDGSTLGGKNALAIGLLAQATGKQISYYISGCLNGGYIQATGVRTDPSW